MIDELKLLDTAIKALTALRDREDNFDDEEYFEYLLGHIERLERKQAEKILEYEAMKENHVPRITEKEEAYRDTVLKSSMVNGYDENDGWYDEDF